METRDQWYKPNLLYNIHYRPPKKSEPPKMIVETVQFNPSVCTCGEHGCQPQYRIEKRILWTNKEVCNAKQQLKVSDGEKKKGHKENKFEERIRKQDRGIGSVIESQVIGLKEENNQKVCFKIEGDGIECGSVSGDVEIRRGYRANYAVKEKENVQVESDDNNDDEKEEEEKEEIVCKNEVWNRNSKDAICIDEEASNTNNFKENNSNDRNGRNNSQGRNSEGISGGRFLENDFESDFKNVCNFGEKSSKEDQIGKDQTTGESDRAVDRDDDGDDELYRSEKRVLINNSDETAESCSLESMGRRLEDEEIASTFGIMSIYCNSELHSWMSFEGDDASEKIHLCFHNTDC